MSSQILRRAMATVVFEIFSFLFERTWMISDFAMGSREKDDGGENCREIRAVPRWSMGRHGADQWGGLKKIYLSEGFLEKGEDRGFCGGWRVEKDGGLIGPIDRPREWNWSWSLDTAKKMGKARETEFEFENYFLKLSSSMLINWK